MKDSRSPLQQARDYERAQAALIPPEARPLFHLTPMVGWANDPNGFCYYQGQYHLFYQYHPYGTAWGPMHWGHAVSADLLTWRYLPAALAPDTPADAGGCFSGSAVETPDGRLLLMYTGVHPKANIPQETDQQIQAQCIAFGDGKDFYKDAHNPVITAESLPNGYSAHDFRDPKIWLENGKYRCVAANRQAQRQGSILLFESDDARQWRFVSELDASDGALGKMWECPDFFRLDGRQVLLVSPQEMEASPDGWFHAGFGTIALLGRWDEAANAFSRECVQPVDSGMEFYAPQTVLAPDGRRIMIGWMENWETCRGAAPHTPWFGRMSLPRELRICGGRLCQAPVRELQALWQDTAAFTALLRGTLSRPDVRGRRMDLTVTLHTGEAACRLFRLRFAQQDTHYTELAYDFAQGTLTFDRSRCGSRRDIVHTRCLKVPCRKELQLRVILDGDSVEVFVNEGEQTISALTNAPPHAEEISFSCDGDLPISVEAHTLGR